MYVTEIGSKYRAAATARIAQVAGLHLRSIMITRLVRDILPSFGGRDWSCMSTWYSTAYVLSFSVLLW